jgi:hypothetical protein
MKMRSSDAFPSKYIKAVDFVGKTLKLTIDHCQTEIMQGKRGEEEKPVLYFRGKDKGLVLNKTNFENIENVFGDSDDWPGADVVVTTHRVRNPDGKIVDGFKVEAAPDVAPTPAPAPAPAPAAAELDDEIPF